MKMTEVSTLIEVEKTENPISQYEEYINVQSSGMKQKELNELNNQIYINRRQFSFRNFFNTFLHKFRFFY